jgi:hypothetical protein
MRRGEIRSLREKDAQGWKMQAASAEQVAPDTFALKHLLHHYETSPIAASPAVVYQVLQAVIGEVQGGDITYIFVARHRLAILKTVCLCRWRTLR